jgi:predicted nucleic acid-binding protein
MNLVDSSGWLEYFAGGENADFFSPAIQNTKNLLVSPINIYEVFKKILQQKDDHAALQAVALMQQGRIADLNAALALFSAKLSRQLNLPMADSMILATAQFFQATLWTQDSHFAGLPEVKFIPG